MLRRFSVWSRGIALTVALVPSAAGAQPLGLPPAASHPPIPRFFVPPAATGADWPGTARYTLDDRGGPPPAIYPEAVPIAFNDDGQILGWTTSRAGIHCEMYTGRAFVDLTPSAAVTVCNPTSLSNAGRNGDVRFVGTLVTKTADTLVPFLGTLDPPTAKSGVDAFSAYGNYYAGMFGVNVWGEAVGQAYKPPGTFFTVSPVFVVPPGTASFVLAQPQCTTLKRYCAQGGGVTCPFGGCVVNDWGTILAVDADDGNYMTFAYGRPGSARDTPIGSANTADVQLNDAGQIGYVFIDQATDSERVHVYSTVTAKTVELPVLPGTACQQYLPLSINNRGQIVGITDSQCAPAVWLWDPKTGIRDISSAIPSTRDSIAPLALNDRGQILVELITPGGTFHWGTLDPPGCRPGAVALAPSNAEHVEPLEPSSGPNEAKGAADVNR